MKQCNISSESKKTTIKHVTVAGFAAFERSRQHSPNK
jgi:hypothetical protein